MAGPTFLVDPENGETYEISDPGKAKTLAEAGWVPESQEQFVDRNVREVVREHPIAGTIAAGTGQFLNQLGLGLPQVIRENTGTEDEKRMKRSLDRAILDDSPVTNIAGGALGTAAALLVTPLGAGLGKLGGAAVQGVQKAAALGGPVAAKVAASKLAKTAIQFGAENAAYNLPYRVTEELLGDPEIASESLMAHAAEDFLVGAGFGVGAQLGTSLVGATLKGVSQTAKGVSPKWLKDKANEFQVKNAGMLTTEIRKLEELTHEKMYPEQLQDTVDLLNRYAGDSQRGGPIDMWNRLEGKLRSTGEELQSIRNGVDKVTGEAIPYSDVADALGGLKQEYSKGSLDIAERVVESNIPVSSVTDAFDKARQAYGPNTNKWPADVIDAVSRGDSIPMPDGTVIPALKVSDPRATPDIKAVDFVGNAWRSQAIEKMRLAGMSDDAISVAFETGEGLPKFTLNELHGFRQSVKESLFKVEKMAGFISDGATGSWKAIGQVMDSHVDKVAKGIGDKTLEGALKKTNKKLFEINQLLKVVEPAAERAAARNKIGLGSTILTGGGYVAGGHIGALGGLAAGHIKQHYGNYIGYKALGTAAKVLENVDPMIKKAMQQALSYQKPLAAARKGATAARIGSVGILSRYIGDEKADPRAAFREIQNDLAIAQSDPETLSSVMEGVSPDFADIAPQNYALMAGTMQRAINYLKTEAPPPPPPIFPGGPAPEWNPSDNDLSKYSRKFYAVMAPGSILEEIANGTLTRESVDAVKAVYPNYFKAIQARVQELLANAPAAQVYRIKAKLGLLLEGMDPPQETAQRIQVLQAGFAPRKDKIQPRTNSKITEASRMGTDLNRALGQ
jgi:hypothetical protein